MADILTNVLAVLLVVGWMGCASTANPVISDAGDLRDSQFDAPIDFWKIDYNRLQAACFFASNDARQANGASTLAYDARLEAAAANYAREMSRGHFVAHVHPSNAKLREPGDRVRAQGVPNPFTAENIALVQGYPVPDRTPVFVRKGGFSLTADGPIIGPHTYKTLAESVVEGWMNSPGHRKNLLSPDALQLGCGAALTSQGEMPMMLFVQNFQLFERISEE